MTFKIQNIAQKGIITALILSVLLTPLMSFAQTNGDSRFCKNLDRIENMLLSKLSDRTDSARDKHRAQVDRYSGLKDERLSNLSDRRNQADQKWKTRIEKLRDGATDAQLDAIDLFVETVEALAKERRFSVDEAISIFEEAVKALRDERTATFNNLLERYKSAISDAFDDARAACDAGTDPAEVRAELRSDITALREAFRAERQNYTYRTDFQELQKERREATASARDTFRSGFERAKEILRKAFGQ